MHIKVVQVLTCQEASSKGCSEVEHLCMWTMLHKTVNNMQIQVVQVLRVMKPAAKLAAVRQAVGRVLT